MARRFPSGLRVVLLALLLAAALPAIGAFLHAAWQHRQESVDSTARQALGFALEAADDLGQTVSAARQVLHRLANTPSLLVERDGCSAHVRALLPLFPQFRNIGGVLPDGQVVCSAIPLPPDVTVAGPWFEEALQTRDIVLRVLRETPLTRIPLIGLLLAARDANDQPSGFFFVTVPVPSLLDLAKGVGLPSGSTLTLFDERGRVMVRWPDAAAWEGSSAAGTSLWKDVSRTRFGDPLRAIDLDGTPMLFGFARIPPGRGKAAAYVAIGIPEETAAKPPARRMAGELAGIAAALALAAVLTWIGIDAFVLRAVRSLAQAARDLASGRLDARVGRPTGALELRQMSLAFDEMAATLERSMGETRHALDSLNDSRGRLQSLARSLLEGQEAERHQLARELHDEVGQALTAASLNLDALRVGQADPSATQRIDNAAGVVREALEQVRNLALDLRPSVLDDLGLVPALGWYVARQAEKTGVAVELATSGPDQRLPGEVETTCFRIAQEAVTNAIRHAGAKRIRIQLEHRDDEVKLTVLDDGTGFDVEAARERARHGRSFGLLGMEERATLIGGTLEIARRVEGGTIVRAVLPALPKGADRRSA